MIKHELANRIDKILWYFVGALVSIAGYLIIDAYQTMQSKLRAIETLTTQVAVLVERSTQHTNELKNLQRALSRKKVTDED